MEFIFFGSLLGLVVWAIYFGYMWALSIWKKDKATAKRTVQKLIRGSGVFILIAFLSLVVGAMTSSPNKTATSNVPTKEEQENKAALEAKKKEEAAERIAKEAKEKDQGLHCLSSWDGSYPQFTKLIKENLRNPRSFEHIETRVWPKDEKDNHKVLTEFRAENGFGGLNVGAASGVFSNSDCSNVRLIKILN